MNFHLQYNEAANSNSETQTFSNVHKDLSDWQERHTVLVLSKVKGLSQLRFKLCPRHLKEGNFWRTYFLLVKSHVAEYELHAIQLAKLKRIAMRMRKHQKPMHMKLKWQKEIKQLVFHHQLHDPNLLYC